MTFEHLLRGSRLASLASPAKSAYFTEAQQFPKNQVVKTTASSFHRRNWGLKSPIPPKHRSVNIHVQALDSDEGLAQYEPASGNVRRLERFRELGVALKLPQGIDADNFFQADSARKKPIAAHSKYELNRLLARAAEKGSDFRKLRINRQRPDSQDQKVKPRDSSDRKSLIDVQDFMGLPKAPPIASNSKNTTAIGLNYSLPGSLFNTPAGFRAKKEVKGRIVDGTQNNIQVAAIGGFVTTTTVTDGMKGSADKAKFSTPHKFIIQQAGVNGSALEIRSAAVSLRSARDHPIRRDSLQRIY